MSDTGPWVAMETFDSGWFLFRGGSDGMKREHYVLDDKGQPIYFPTREDADNYAKELTR